MKSPYDLANELAELIAQEENYIKVKELSEKVMGNKEHMQMITEFRERQFQLQELQMQQIQPAQEDIEATAELYTNLIAHEEIKELVIAEESLRVMYEEINKILTEPFNRIYNVEEEDQLEEFEDDEEFED